MNCISMKTLQGKKPFTKPQIFFTKNHAELKLCPLDTVWAKAHSSSFAFSSVPNISGCLAFMSPSQEMEAGQQPADNVPCHMEGLIALILDGNSQTIISASSTPAAWTIVPDKVSANLVVPKRRRNRRSSWKHTHSVHVGNIYWKLPCSSKNIIQNSVGTGF